MVTFTLIIVQHGINVALPLLQEIQTDAVPLER